MENIPRADIAVIGGSGTYAIEFPDVLGFEKAEILREPAVFPTPFGPSPPLKLFSLPDGRRILTCRMHGWRSGTTRRSASQQIFWIFREAGVLQVLAEGGVGTIHEESQPGEIVVPHDYLDFSCRRDTSLTDDYLLVMRDPFCPALRRTLLTAARSMLSDELVHDRGIYAVTDGRHFESRAEVRALTTMGADIIGQSLAPEVYLAREIGACYAGIHQIVNRAEGVGQDWSHEELAGIFHGRAHFMASLLLEALNSLDPPGGCSCRALRKNTLLRPDPHETQ